MDKILQYIGGVPQSKARNDDGPVDRLNNRYTLSVLVVFSIVVSTKQFVGDRITCWVPAHFSDNWVAYTNSYCWIKNTYNLPLEEYIPKEHEHDKRQMITYYQWVPLILLVQALLFYVPCMIWRTFNNRTGIDLNNLVEAGQTFQSLEQVDLKDKTLQYMTIQINRYLSSQREYHTEWTVSLKNCVSRICCSVCGRSKGNYLVILYLFSKILYVANAILQLFALNIFLGTDFNFYGIDVMQALAEGKDWTESQRFPRVSMCDFNIRRLGNVQRYTVQCVLPINLFNEKIYLFVWFWLIFVAVATCISLLVWFLRTVMASDRLRYVRKHLLLYKKIQLPEDEERLQRFVQNYLRQDGVFILRLVGHNTNAVTTTEFVCSVWDYFINRIDNRPLQPTL